MVGSELELEDEFVFAEAMEIEAVAKRWFAVTSPAVTALPTTKWVSIKLQNVDDNSIVASVEAVPADARPTAVPAADRLRPSRPSRPSLSDCLRPRRPSRSTSGQ
nr:hypothetical protein CFP56_50024 [Quercus suber]